MKEKATKRCEVKPEMIFNFEIYNKIIVGLDFCMIEKLSRPWLCCPTQPSAPAYNTNRTSSGSSLSFVFCFMLCSNQRLDFHFTTGTYQAIFVVSSSNCESVKIPYKYMINSSRWKISSNNKVWTKRSPLNLAQGIFSQHFTCFFFHDYFSFIHNILLCME